MFYLGIVLLGMIAVGRLPISLFPDIVFPRLTILTPYGGVAPEEMENLVTRPVEDAVSSVPGVHGIESRSQEGLSIVEVQLEWGASLDLAIIQLRQKLDLARALLPQDSGRSILVRYDPASMPIVSLVARPRQISGDQLRDTVDREVRPFLERIPGVASINILGGRKREIRVDVDARRLRGFGLNLSQLNQALGAANFAFPAGQVYKGDREYTVRFQGEFRSVDEIKNTIIHTGEGGQPVYLHQLAEVLDDFKDPRGEALYNGQRAVVVGLKKEPGKNTVATALAIRKSLKEINHRFGQRLQFAVIQDRSLYVSGAISSVAQATALGGLVAFMILLFFLKDLRAAMIILVSIPVAILSTFVLMFARDISLNIMSLGGLSLGIGMLVDNSIVVLEAIYQQRDRDPEASPRTHAVQGTRSVSASITASTLTSIIVFLPIIFVSGVAGAVFSDLAWTVSFALVSSLITALSLIPMLCALPLGDKINGFVERFNHRLDPLYQIADGLVAYLIDKYLYVLDYALRNPGRVLGVTAGLSLAGVLAFWPLEKRLFPEVDRGEVQGVFHLHGGTDIDHARDVHLRLQKFIKKNNLAKHSITVIGYDEDDIDSLMKGVRKPDFAEAEFFLDADEIDSQEFIESMQIASRQSGSLEASYHLRGDALQELMGEAAGTLQLDFEGRDRTSLRSLADFAFDDLRRVEKQLGLIGLTSTSEARDPEMRLHLDRQRIASLGLAPGNVAQLLRSAVDGGVATAFRKHDQEIDVRVRLRAVDRRQIEQLRSLFVPVGQNRQVELGDLLHSESSRGMPTVLRENQHRLERVKIQFPASKTSDVRDYLDLLINKLENKKTQMHAEDQDITIRLQQANAETMQSLQGLLFAMGLSSILIYMLLAGQFESLVHPLTLAMTIPTMLWGAGAALLLTGHSLNITSAIGLILLVGIVVNAAIVLYEYIEQKRADIRNQDDELLQLPEILKEAGRDRLRPILLTTITTLCGMLPLALELGEGSEMQSPMAVAVIGGLSVASVVTLVAFPALYFVVERYLISRRKKADA